MHLNEWTIARVQRHLDPDQGLQAVRVWHAHGPDLKPETSGGCVDVQRVLHHPLLATEEHNVEGGVAGRWNHLQKNQSVRFSLVLKYSSHSITHQHRIKM